MSNQVVNPLVQTFPNWSDLDTLLRSVEDKTITTATELKTGSVHALNRADTDADCFRFVATSNFTAGETFLLDGEQVTALTVSGEQLSTGAYVIGSNVLVMVHDTLLSFIVPEATSKDSEKLGGELPSYYGKQSDVTQLDTDMNAINTKVGAGVLQTEAQNCVGAINELNTHLKALEHNDFGTEIDEGSGYTTATDGYYVFTNNRSVGTVQVQLNGIDVITDYCTSDKPYMKRSVYVKKGMTITHNNTSLSGGYYSKFYPLES